MITIFIWPVYQLPAALAGLAPWLSLLGTALFWGLVAVILRYVLFAVLHQFTRRTETDIDDVLMSVTSTPLFLTVVLFGLYNSFENLGFHDVMVSDLEQAFIVAIIAIVTVWVYRLFKEVVIFYGKQLAEQTESNLDDVLIPIARQIGPIVIFIAGGLVILQYLGVNLDNLLIAIGGLSFILAFALQDILSNVFSGISLIVDTPFSYRDLIVLSDGTLCEVRKIGLRVTELYNVKNHSVIYMPNSQLANERLANITRPSPDLIDTIAFAVDGDTDPKQVITLMEEVLYGHPDVLGDLDKKTTHLPQYVELEAADAKRANGLERLQIEKQIDTLLKQSATELDRLARRIRRFEKGGLEAPEIKELNALFEPILTRYGFTAKRARVGRNTEMILEINDQPATLYRLVREWITVWACDPNLTQEAPSLARLTATALWTDRPENSDSDPALLIGQWERRLRHLQTHLLYIARKLADPTGVEQRLDNLVLDFSLWVRQNFKDPHTPWKNPDVNFNGPDGNDLTFELEFYIDDIELEHFERQERVRREIWMEIVRRFREAAIAFPSEQRDVTLHHADD